MNAQNSAVAFKVDAEQYASCVIASPASWYAVHVRSRHEFTVALELRKKGVETFLPSVFKLNQWKDRKQRVETALFPGYVFVFIEPKAEQFLNVIKTRGTVTFVSLTPGHPTPIAREEIESLRIVLASGAPIDVYSHLQEGMPVRVTRGVFQGARGILQHKPDGHVFIVTLELLGRSVGVKLYADDLEAA